MEKIDILIVDDHKLFREGVELVLKGFDNIGSIVHASDGIEFLELLKNYKPSVVLMDINMPEMDGVQATTKAKKIYPELKIIALSVLCETEYYNQMTNAGVSGFILKNTDSSELLRAINAVTNNQQYFSQELLQKVVNTKTEQNKTIEVASLTKRELEIVVLIAKGLSNIEISEKIFISKRTVERHKSNIYTKINCKSSIDIMMFAVKNGLIQV